jgi:hypothetical protein
MRGLPIALSGATRSRVRKFVIGCAAAVLGGSLLAEAAVAADKTVVPYDTEAWAGLNWGLGIAADFDIGGTRVSQASIVGGLVRLNDTSSNVGVSFVLEAHYFLRDYTFAFGSSVKAPGGCTSGNVVLINCTELAHGPFVAIEVGGGSTSAAATNGPITGYALGWMVGMHHPKLDATTGKQDTTSWNLGVGLRIDPKAQVLGDGFVPNMPPPAGETVIRYKTEPKAGVMVMSSFSF